MRNKLIDLNNHLFAQLERLSDEGLSPEQLDMEVSRAKAINGVAQNIIDNAKVALDGMKFVESLPDGTKQLPEQFPSTQTFSNHKVEISSCSMTKVKHTKGGQSVDVMHKFPMTKEKGVNARSRAALEYANGEGYKNVAEAIASMGKPEFDKAVTNYMDNG